MSALSESGKIGKVNVLMEGVDIFYQDEGGLWHDAASHERRHLDRLSLTMKLHPKACFLFDLPECGVVRELVTLDVPTGRQPEPLLGMPVQQHFSGVHNERRCCKVSGKFTHTVREL